VVSVCWLFAEDESNLLKREAMFGVVRIRYPPGLRDLFYLGEDLGNIVVVEVFDHLCKHGG